MSSESNNFFIHKFNIERFAAQLQSNAASANSEYTRLMPLTDDNPMWDLHVYDWRAMLNGVAIIAPETTLTEGSPEATTADTVPRPPRDHLLLVDCPDPVAGSGRQLTQNGSLSLGEDSSLNCGILQNYIWNEPADGKTALLKLIVNREPRVGVEILLANVTGTTNYVRCRNFLCGNIQSNCTLAVAGDGLPGASYDSTVYIQAECGPVEAATRTITFTVIQRGAPGNPPGDVPDGACFSDYLYWETDPTNGIPRWMPGSTTADQLNGTPPDAGPTCVHIGCEAGGVSTPAGQPGPSTVTSRQFGFSVAVGSYAGHSAQGSAGALAETGAGTAIGFSAGRITQNFGATAIGSFAGNTNQGELAVALGQQAGFQNNDASNVRPTRNGTGDSGCIQLNLANGGTGYSNGTATITTPGTPISVELVVNLAGVIQSLTVLCGSGSGLVPGDLPWTGTINPNGAGPAGAGGIVTVTALGVSGSSAAEQLERTIVINGSVEGGLNTDDLNVQGHPAFPRAPGVVPGGGQVWADACYVKPIREQTYSNQLAPPNGDYRWGLYYNQNTGEIVCSDVNTPGIPNGNCMSEYLYWNNVQGDWLIGGGNDISNMSDFSVHFGCQAMGDLEAVDGYGQLGENAVAVGVNSAQFSTGDGRGRATAVGPFSGYTGQGRDAVAIGAAAGLGIVPQNGTLTSGTGAAITAVAIHGQFQNSVVLSGRGYQTNNPDLPLNTLNPLLLATSPVGTGNAAGVFTFTPPNTMLDGDVVVGMLVQSLTGFVGFAAGTYVCGRVPAASGGDPTSITICGPNGAPLDLTPVTQVVLGNPQPVVDPVPALPNVGGAEDTTGGFFVAPLRQSPRNFLLVYDTSNKEILYEAYPQHNRLNAGDCYSDYLYWSPLAQKWLVGSLQVHIGCGAGGDDVSGQESEQGPGCVAVGRGAGHCGQGGGGGVATNGRSVAIGVMSGVTDQGVGAVSVGSGISATDAIPAAGDAFAANLGQISQGQYSVSVGCEAGRFSQGQTPGNAVAVGHRAGHTVQGAQAIAIGADAGFTGQGVEGRAIGRCAAYSGQGANATAVGTLAGNYDTNCPPNRVVGQGGVNNIQVGYEANQQPASSIILNAALGNANANVDLNFNYVMLTAAPSQGLNGVFTWASAHLPVASDAGAAVVSIYNISSGQDFIQAGDRVRTPVVGNQLIIEHHDGSVETYPMSAGGYRIIIRNTVASPLMTGDALPLQALSQIGEVGFDAVADPTFRSPVSGFFVSPIRQINKNYQLSYDPTTKEITYQYQQVPPDIGIGDCYSEYLYWDDGEGADPLTEGWRVGGGPEGFQSHDYGRVHFGCGAAQYQTGTVNPVTGNITNFTVGLRAENLTVAVGYNAGRVAFGRGENPNLLPLPPMYSNPGAANVAIGYRAGYVDNFPRSVSIGFEAGYSGQGTVGSVTPGAYENSTNLDSCVSIGNQAGRDVQSLGSVAIGGACGRTGQGGHSVAIGSQAAQTSQGFHALALGHMAGCSMSPRPPGAGQGIFPDGPIENQSSNSIIINCGDPMNQNVAETDWGPLQSIAGTNLACGASLTAAGTGYAVGNALTAVTVGGGSGMVIRILQPLGVGDAITDFAVVHCGSGYSAGDQLNVIQQGHNGTFAQLTITNTENFPGPAVGASEADVACIQNQKLHGNAMPQPGQLVTGFFASPVRNCSGGYVMSYNPCTKEIKYNASKTVDDLADVDVGDCYSEYLYWDDGLGTTYAGNPGWKIGGTSLAGSDNGRVHIGCNAGEQAGASAAPSIGDRAANLTIAIGFEAGQYGLGRYDNGLGANDNRGNIVIGYQAGWDRMYPRSIAIGYQAGRVFQGAQGSPNEGLDGDDVMDANVAIGNYAGENNQHIGSIAVGALAGRDTQEQFALAVGLQAGRTNQGWHSIALGHKAGFNMPARAPFPAGAFDAQSRNSIIVNAGDPKNNNPTEADWGPLQAISGSSSACGASITIAGTGYATGVAMTTALPPGGGHGFIINIFSVDGGGIETFGIVSCGSGYASGDTVSVTGGNNDAVLTLNNREIFPAPSASASGPESACILNQGSQADMPTSAGQPVTGFFVNPVRNVGGGFVMAYDPCTKEIKYNASRSIGDLPDLDDGDCYSEYLYWDDGLGTDYLGDPGWKVGGGPLDPTQHPDRGRVHIGCGAGQYQALNTPGTRAGQQIVAVGHQAGHIAMATQAIAIGAQAGYCGQSQDAVAMGYQAGYNTQGQDAVAIGHLAGNDQQQANAVAIGLQAGRTAQSQDAVAIGHLAGGASQSPDAVAIGHLAGNLDQDQYAIAIGLGAGQTEQAGYAVAIGANAGGTQQGDSGVAIGRQAGGNVQGIASVAIGVYAGSTTQQDNCIAIGHRAGDQSQQDNCIAIGSRGGAANSAPGQYSQQTLSIAIGFSCGHTQQGIAGAGAAGSALAIGNTCSQTQQGANSIAIGYEAGQSHGARGVFPAGQVYQSINSIVINSGDPKNVGVNATLDHGPLQAIAGESNVCAVASISAPGGTGYSTGSATTTYVPGPGTGSGMVVEITSVGVGGAVTGVTIIDCGSGYANGDVLTLIQAGSGNNATITLSSAETFPTPNPGAGATAIACVNNQGSNANMPPAGAAVTGFFVNPVRNCSGGFVMSYNPCTKEIKYNASKLADHLPDFDLQSGDCYAEYLYWDDGLGTAYAGDPGWKVGGGPADGQTNPDRGRVHVGCGAGQYQAAGNAGGRAGEQTVAVGFQAGHIAMAQGTDPDDGRAVAIGSLAGYDTQGKQAVAVGHQAGRNTQGIFCVAIGPQSGLDQQSGLATAVGYQAGQTRQGPAATAVGCQAGREGQLQGAVAVGYLAGNHDQGMRAVAVGDSAGKTEQSMDAVAVGNSSGETSQGQAAVAVGWRAGQVGQSQEAVAVGRDAGNTNQGPAAIAIGLSAGLTGQGESAIALGSDAGRTTQGLYAVAIGEEAGANVQSQDSIAIGHLAGSDQQSTSCVAIGVHAGRTSQSMDGIAIGNTAGSCAQSQRAIAIGTEAGDIEQGLRGIAVGHGAGQSHAARAPFPAGAQRQPANSVIFNSGDPRNAGGLLVDWGPLQAVAGQTNLGGDEIFPNPEIAQTSEAERLCIYNQNKGPANPESMPPPGSPVTGFFVNPVRNCSGGFVLAYNPCTKEIKYNASKPIEDIPADLDQGDCYSEYLYWDNGADGVIPLGWRKGGGTAGINNHDYGRVHIGCEAGFFNAAGNEDPPVSYTNTGRQSQYSVAVGYKAGRQGQGENNGPGYAIAIGYQSGLRNQATRAIAIGMDAAASGQGQRAVAIGVEAGKTEQGDYAIAIGQTAGKTQQGDNSIAIGRDSALGGQGTNAVAIGHSAGSLSQSQEAVAIGYQAGRDNQGQSAVAIGEEAGNKDQADYAVAVGEFAGSDTQGASAVAIGRFSGYTQQGASATAMGHLAGSENQSNNAVAVGHWTARYDQGEGAVAIGSNAGRGVVGTGQGVRCVAVGYEAGFQSQLEYAIAIGYEAGYTNQGIAAIAIGATNTGGQAAGYYNQGNYAVAIGPSAGYTSQGVNAVAIASGAGQQSQGGNSVAIGLQAGRYNQTGNSVAIGPVAAYTGQTASCIAIGNLAGENTQGSLGGGSTGEAIAIGNQAARFNQLSRSVAIGASAGRAQQTQVCVAIGSFAGTENQGQVGGGFFEGGAVAIGHNAGQTDQHALSIAVGPLCGTQGQQPHSIAVGALNTQSVTAICQGADSTILGNSYSDVPAGALCLGSRVNLGPIQMNGQAANATYIQQIRGPFAFNINTNPLLQWNTSTREVTYSTKSFVKEHPVDRDRYLVHACLEGPENGLYYRGKGVVPENEKSVLVQLPRYACLIGCDWTIQLTAQGSFNRFYATEVADDDGFVGFRVFAEQPGKFYWIVHGRQKDKPLETEPRKADVVLRGQGPYTFLQKR